MNNPLMFTDPDGEWIITTMVIVGAYLGGAAANKNKESGKWGWNPTKWEPNLKTLGGVVGGAALGYLGGSAVQGLFAGTTTLNIGVGGNYLATGVKLNLSGTGAIIKGAGIATAAGGGVWLTHNYLTGKKEEGSYVDMTMVNQVADEQRAQDLFPIIGGTTSSVLSEMYYSDKYGTWMGKNFKIYKQTWGGNGFTGGKRKFAKNISTGIKLGGYGFGIWSSYKIDQQYRSGTLPESQKYIEQSSNLISTAGGLYGAAWALGWEFGRGITNMTWYQEAKFNFWYNRWENKVGSPSRPNEVLWNHFYKNYKP